jgi:hypothetical protein
METITIPKEEYDKLVKAANWLSCLEAAGVDNWDGWDIAVEMNTSKEEE